ncbi:hypothetical protein JFK97_05995 [Chromobacterium phragmitis]|uniref:hypothetical protein n=1 Tax=Chromobacterium amazonense TaxID=1382803 RepID=UPI0021B7E45D|nr:hypothetical protein [Chromobacterium amazonense]MBM2883937.1 hypothetical protein [Chromobacterium amazonense]MDE1711854.1 hypothetical protein [Chromobacterium amazonense]
MDEVKKTLGLQQQITELRHTVASLQAALAVTQHQVAVLTAQLPQAIRSVIGDEIRPGGMLYRARSGDGARVTHAYDPSAGRSSPESQPEIGSTFKVSLPEGQAQAQVVGTYPPR